MKKFMKIYVLAAIVAFGSVALTSCEKEAAQIPQTQPFSESVAPATKRIFDIDEYFKDSQRNVWHIVGLGHKHDNRTMELKVKVRYENETPFGQFEGVVRFFPGGSYQVSTVYRLNPDMEQLMAEFAWHLLHP